MGFGDYLKMKREDRGYTITQLAVESRISNAQISRIENGERGVPKPDTLQKLSEALNVPHEEMMVAAGYLDDMVKEMMYQAQDDPDRRTDKAIEKFSGLSAFSKVNTYRDYKKILSHKGLTVSESSANYVAGLKPVEATVNLPVVGRISCGDGGLAFDDIEGYEPTPKEWLNGGEYFYLRAKGDSMIGARIQDGDLLLIRKQPEVENGEIAAVMIDDEALLKRVYRNGDQLVLQSENPKYPPIFAPPAKAKIIGKLKMVTIKF